MKKTLIFVLIVLLAVLSVISCVAFAEEQASPTSSAPTVDEENAEVKEFVKELCELNAQGNKADKVDYLVTKFREALDSSALDSEVTTAPFIDGDGNYCNIVARLKKDNSLKQIIVGAHYDAIGGEGAGDNAVGVAALYYTMKLLASANDIPYNVTFVAFDGEENGLLGSRHFVDRLSAEQAVNTLVMFNIDSIALGEDVYLMCENKHTRLADAILKNSKDIVEKPYAKGIYGSYMEDIYGYGYYEFVQGSDHTPFRLAGIPIAFFFSGDYSGTWNFNAGNVINTASDTYENLVNSGVAWAVRIQNVGEAIANTVLSNGFAEIAENARSQLVNLGFWYNKWWASLVILAVLVVLAIFTWLYSRKLQKRAILGRAEINSQKVFDKPDASEIFTFDDIFTFKE